METTAAQIAGYTGNSSAAIGSSFGGGTGLTQSLMETNSDSIFQSLDNIALHTFQKNKILYEQKIKDRDKLRDLMEKEEVNPGVLLDKDRELIEAKYVKPINDLLIQNPNIAQDNTKYQQLQKMLGEFRQAKAYGGLRLAARNDLQKQISEELDPQKRARMQAHLDNLLKEDIYTLPKPFQQTLDYDPNVILAKPEPIQTKGTRLQKRPDGTVGDVMETITTSHTPLKEFTKRTWANYIDSPNKSIADQMDVFAKSFHEMSDAQKAEQVQIWNDKIKSANLAEGYKPGDADYVKPIEAQMFDGKLIVTGTVPELVRAHAISQNYVNSESVSEDATEMGSKIRGADANAKKALQEAKLLIPSQAAENYAQARKADADALKTKEDAKIARDKAAQENAQGSFYIQETVQAFDPRKYKGLPRLAPDGNMSWNEGGTIQTRKTSMAGVTGTILHNDMENGRSVSALSPFQMQAIGARFKVEGKTTVIEPKTVIYNDSNPKNPYFVAKYEWTNESDQEQEVTDAAGKKTKVKPRETVKRILQISPMDFAKGAIKTSLGEDAAGNEGAEYGKFITEFRKRANGSENVNGNIISLSEAAENKPGESDYNTSQQEFNSIWNKKKP